MAAVRIVLCLLALFGLFTSSVVECFVTHDYTASAICIGLQVLLADLVLCRDDAPASRRVPGRERR